MVNWSAPPLPRRLTNMFRPLLVGLFTLATIFTLAPGAAAAEDPVQWTLTFDAKTARLARAGQVHWNYSTALARLFDDHASGGPESDDGGRRE